MKRRVWIISEGSPGHVSQSKGLVEALSRRFDLDCEIFETRPRLNGFLRDLVRYWINLRGVPLAPFIVRHILRCIVPTDRKPDFIITSGGKAVFASHAIAASVGVPLVFIGERKPYPSEWFHTVFTPAPAENGCNDFQIEIIPTQVTLELVNAAADAWPERPSGRLWTMLIGGNSASHQYTQLDWQNLASAMNKFADLHDIRWLVSTSRRTGVAAESALRAALKPEYLAAVIWWAQNPLPSMQRYLGASELVFTTQDSVTMVTEAASSGRPVVAVWPEHTSLEPSGFLESYFRRLEAARRIHRCPMSELHGLDPAALNFEPRLHHINDELAGVLAVRFSLQ